MEVLLILSTMGFNGKGILVLGKSGHVKALTLGEIHKTSLAGVPTQNNKNLSKDDGKEDSRTIVHSNIKHDSIIEFKHTF